MCYFYFIFYFCPVFCAVGNIPYDVTEEMLKEIFSEAGSVVNFRYVRATTWLALKWGGACAVFNFFSLLVL